MKYMEVPKLTEIQIVELSSSTDDSLALEAISSAIFFCDAEFAAGLLLKCLEGASGMRRFHLMGYVLTYIGVHQTDYMVESLISEMRNFAGLEKAFHEQANKLIEGAIEESRVFQELAKAPSKSSTDDIGRG